MFKLIRILIGLSLPILLTWLFFVINPILGIMSTIWFIGLTIYGIKKK